jgi:tetratricopeptide (TPR) repeat protein
MIIFPFVPARVVRVSLIGVALLATGAAFAQNASDCGKKTGNENIAACTAALRLNPRDPYPYVSRGISFDSRREHDRAIVDFNEALKLDPAHPGALTNRGDAYRSKGDHDRAIADYTHSLKFRETSNPLIVYQAFFGRGLAYKTKGDNARAIADFRSALRVSTDEDDKKDAEKALRDLGVNP